ncbi:MAG: hypothetical protein AAGG07_12455 [Planctomycetota bacterium]
MAPNGNKRISGKKLVPVVLLVLVAGALATLGARLTGGMDRLRAAGFVDGGVRGGGIDEWIGRQLVGLVNKSLNPQLGFEALEYNAPYTVRMRGATLTALDETRVVDVEQLEITLAERPKRGRPLIIERIVIKNGTLNLERDESTGAIKGLSNIVKNTDEQAEEPEETAGKLSDTIRLRSVVLDNAAVRYAPGGGKPPMVLDGLTTEMVIQPDAANEGMYTIELDTGRPPALTLNGLAHLDLDNKILELDQTVATLELSPETIRALPPQVQRLLGSYEVAGELHATLNGTVPLEAPTSGDARLDLEVEDVRLASDGFQLPIDRLEVSASLAGGYAELEAFDAWLLGGFFGIVGSMDLNDDSPRPVNASLWIDGIQLRQLIDQTRAPTPEDSDAAGTEDAPSGRDLAGLVNAAIDFATEMEDPAQRVRGSGELTITEGRLVMLPGVTRLSNLLSVRSSDDRRSNHRARMRFFFLPEHVFVSSVELITNALAAEGSGRIGYDGQLALDINAGPFKRLTKALGFIGEAVSLISDRSGKYQVRGRLGDPQLSFTSLGVNRKSRELEAGDARDTESGDGPADDVVEDGSDG